MRLLFAAIVAMTIVATPPASGKDAEDDARATLLAAVDVAGGETWLEPRTLVLEGTADFYAPDQPGVVSHSDDYRMWRAMDPNRRSAHGADGKVRILARKGTAKMFEVGFDGATTWNEKGLVPKAEADAFWATNFGFGVIRQALKEGFRLQSAPTRSIDGHALDMIRVIDPAGQETLFGIDRESRFIRYMGFSSPRGWHERVYDDFVVLEDPRWLQAREVTLFYNGVRANTVHWKVARVNEVLPDEIFAVPARLKGSLAP